MEQQLQIIKDELAGLQIRVEVLERNLSNYGSIPLEAVNAMKRYFPTVLWGSATIDIGSIAAGASTSASIPVAGAKPGDAVALGIAGVAAGNDLIFLPSVGSENIVSVTVTNTHAANAIDPASGVYTAFVFQKP